MVDLFCVSKCRLFLRHRNTWKINPPLCSPQTHHHEPDKENRKQTSGSLIKGVFSRASQQRFKEKSSSVLSLRPLDTTFPKWHAFLCSPLVTCGREEGERWLSYNRVVLSSCRRLAPHGFLSSQDEQKSDMWSCSSRMKGHGARLTVITDETSPMVVVITLPCGTLLTVGGVLQTIHLSISISSFTSTTVPDLTVPVVDLYLLFSVFPWKEKEGDLTGPSDAHYKWHT